MDDIRPLNQPRVPMNPTQNQLPPHHAPVSLKLLLVFFAIALLAALGYLVWQQPQISAVTTDEGILHPKTAAIPVKTPTVDPTANWKTYTNAGLKFSFKYPATFTVTDALQASGKATTGNQKLVLTDIATTGQPTLTVLVDPPGFDGAPTNLLYTFKLNASNMLTTSTPVKQTIDPLAPSADSTHYIAGTNIAGQLLNGRMFVIRYSYLTGNDTLLTTFDEMVKTFTINP